MADGGSWLVLASSSAARAQILRNAGLSFEAEPADVPVSSLAAKPVGSLKELFGPLYGPRSLMLWVMWFGTYMVNNGLVTWLPTLYKTVFDMPVAKAITYGFISTGFALVASLACALLIDKDNQPRWEPATPEEVSEARRLPGGW